MQRANTSVRKNVFNFLRREGSWKGRKRIGQAVGSFFERWWSTLCVLSKTSFLHFVINADLWLKLLCSAVKSEGYFWFKKTSCCRFEAARKLSIIFSFRLRS